MRIYDPSALYLNVALKSASLSLDADHIAFRTGAMIKTQCSSLRNHILYRSPPTNGMTELFNFSPAPMLEHRPSCCDDRQASEENDYWLADATRQLMLHPSIGPRHLTWFS